MLEIMQIVKISPKGQITIPKRLRKLCKTGSFALDVTGHAIVLRPIEIKIINDDLENFSALGEKSFEFWNNEQDDIYQKFYNKK